MSRTGRFRFSLETVLQVRTLREEQARLALAEAVAAYQQIRMGLEEAKTNLAAVSEDLGKDWTPADYQILCAYLNGLQSRTEDLTQRLSRQSEDLQARQEGLQKLHQEKRLLERWRERLYREFLREEKSRGEKEVEDAALARWTGK
jgi:flagellar FliJ protein